MKHVKADTKSFRRHHRRRRRQSKRYWKYEAGVQNFGAVPSYRPVGFPDVIWREN
jgi:hypothetical protein